MNFKVLALSTMVMFSGTALAQTAPTSGVYVGAAVGTTMQNASDVTAGVVLGYRFNRVLAAEVTYDREWRNRQDGGLLMLNGVVELPVHNRFRPYALAGVGLGFDHFNLNRADQNGTPMYNIGGGVRVALTTNLDLDARYRYIAPINTGNSQRHASMLTFGVNYRF
jgi:opacity protein-like surface antigen